MLFELENVGFGYPDGTAALRGVTESIGRGSRLAIVGANGCGKSTLLQLMNGLSSPSSGQIRFEGRVLSDKTLCDPLFQLEFRSRVGFVFQDADAQLYRAAVSDEAAYAPIHLGIGGREARARLQEMLEFLGIAHFAGRPPFSLSAGEKRKVAIASVLAMEPDVILLDEPFANLDPRAQQWLLQTLHELQSRGKTTIVATHSLDWLPEIASRVMVLSEEHEHLGTFDVDCLLAELAVLNDANLNVSAADVSVFSN